MRIVGDAEEEKRMKLVAEARHLAVASPVLLPMLEAKRSAAFNKLISIYREGKTDFMTTIAELSVLESIKREVLSKIEYLQLMEDRQNGNSKQPRE